MGKLSKRSTDNILFAVKSKFGFLVSTTKIYWDVIVHIKHPTLKGKEAMVKEVLSEPDEVRVSKKDSSVFLFYKKFGGRYLCVVVKLFKNRGFIITAYLTKKIKEGKLKWRK